MRLAIADPPYPPLRGAAGIKPRASRWYGDNALSSTDVPADVNPEARDWDDPARHRQLLVELHEGYDGWAIATTPDGIQAYGELPLGTRIMAWVKPSSQPGNHRLQSRWEPVITYPPLSRVNSRGPLGAMPDVLIAPPPRNVFIGAKPFEWTRWVLDALGYDPVADELVDVFPGSGSVGNAAAQGVLL